MSVLDIVYYGNSVLRKKCRNINKSEDVSTLIEDMMDSMYEAEGIGLAANQIGVDMNIFVIDIQHTDEKEFPRVFINGKILESEGESIYSEGCLSLPNLKFDVVRPEKIKFEYLDENKKKRIENFDGLLARAIQHEMDHLNGILIIDRVSDALKIPFLKEIRHIKNISKKRSTLKLKPELYL